MKPFPALLSDPPKAVAWSDIVDCDRLDERRSCIDCLHANILGVNEGHVEWSPNDSPPSQAETLAWLWFIRPDLGVEIASEAPADLRNLIWKYEAGDMEAWWKEMT
jgi:hypothetical protein